MWLQNKRFPFSEQTRLSSRATSGTSLMEPPSQAYPYLDTALPLSTLGCINRLQRGKLVRARSYRARCGWSIFFLFSRVTRTTPFYCANPRWIESNPLRYRYSASLESFIKCIKSWIYMFFYFYYYIFIFIEMHDRVVSNSRLDKGFVLSFKFLLEKRKIRVPLCSPFILSHCLKG